MCTSVCVCVWHTDTQHVLGRLCLLLTVAGALPHLLSMLPSVTSAQKLGTEHRESLYAMEMGK